MPSCRHAVASRRLWAAASALALLLAACEDLTIPGGSLPTDDLLMLPLASSAPAPASVSFYLSNAHASTRNLIHNDGFNTLFARLEVPAGGLTTLDGTSLGPDDSVLVTLTADPAVYGIRLTPDGLRFTTLGAPRLTFSYVKYGNLTVADGSRYADQTAYANALDVWRETSLDRWVTIGGSGAALSDIATNLSQAGHYVVAASR